MRMDARDTVNRTPLDIAAAFGSVRCSLLVERATRLREEGRMPVDGRLSLDWTEGTHDLLAPKHRELLHRAVGALLLVDARREGLPLGRESALAVVEAVARAARV